jgi:Flp pilus assembly protein CpaB
VSGAGSGSRRRAIAFALLAVAAAALAAAIADGYGSRIARSYGALRRVVVVRKPLAAGRPIGPEMLESELEVRRVPTRFVPPGTLTRPEEALGLAPRAELAPGSYLGAPALRAPNSTGRAAVPGLRAGQRPVQISVSGAGALLSEADGAARPQVDVVVTTEPTAGGRGRTYVAASDVPLLGIDPIGSSSPGATSTATLGLTRRQALELIAAENFARQVALLPRAGSVNRLRSPPGRRASPAHR